MSIIVRNIRFTTDQRYYYKSFWSQASYCSKYSYGNAIHVIKLSGPPTVCSGDGRGNNTNGNSRSVNNNALYSNSDILDFCHARSQVQVVIFNRSYSCTKEPKKVIMSHNAESPF